MLGKLSRQLLLFLLYGFLGALLAVIVIGVIYLESRTDLEVWHTVDLENEYRVGGEIDTFEDYLALEARLFQELEEKVINQRVTDRTNLLNRYARGSLSSSERWARNWNRSFELKADAPRAGVLMLHGMSDSPYSMRALAERLHDAGLDVIGLRYPGHGTAPSSLTETRWQDMAGAVELAARHLANRLDGKPLYVFGYSTGGPLAVDLALNAMEDDAVPMPDGLVLFSSAMGVTAAAALAPWQARLGRLLGLEKFKWNSISMEYDPFKYRSFPLNAAIQVWLLSNHVKARMTAAAASGALMSMPPILSFQSVVDDTISVNALLDALYDKLPEGGHELVAYDINRRAGIEELLAIDPWPEIRALLDRDRRYAFTVVTNAPANDGMFAPAVLSMRSVAGGAELEVCSLNLSWPPGAYSLTHIALPFPGTDPLYGGANAEPHPGINLGNVVLRGEGSALRVSPAGFLRQSWNPFFDFQYEKLAQFIGIGPPVACSPG